MNPALESYLNKISQLQGEFPGMKPSPYDSGITPHDWVAEVDQPALRCNKVILGSNDREDRWWFQLYYRDSYDGGSKPISIHILRLAGDKYEWEDYRQEILRHIELMSENEILSELEIELARATYRFYDTRYAN